MPSRRQLLELLTGKSEVTPYEPGRTYKLTILHTNDTHGHFWRDKDGQFGFAALKTLVDRARAEVRAAGGQVLLLSGGDINTGTPRSDLQDAEPDFRAMNLLGYDAMAIGNHEFDKPGSVLERQQRISDFRFLSSNIYRRSDDQHAFARYLLRDFDGLKVAVFGLTTEDTPITSNPDHTRPYRFRPAVEEARELVPRLREKASVIIGLTHIGYYGDDRRAFHEPADRELAAATEGIDIIVGGHTQIEIPEPQEVNGSFILQAGEWGKALGRMDVEILDGRIVSKKYDLIPVNKKTKRLTEAGTPALDEAGRPILDPVRPLVPEDPEMLALLTPYYDAGGRELARVLGTIDRPFVGRDAQLQRETNLGRLVCAAQREATGAQISIMNDGGLRATLDAGEVTYEEVLSVMPFGNTLCTFTMSAPQLCAYLDAIDDQPIHLSGVEIRRRDGKIEDVRVNGVSLDRDAASTSPDAPRYSVCVNKFIAQRGDGWPDVSRLDSFVDTGFNDAYALVRYLEAHDPIDGEAFERPNIVDEPATTPSTPPDSRS